jgi:hypothetical protein
MVLDFLLVRFDVAFAVRRQVLAPAALALGLLFELVLLDGFELGGRAVAAFFDEGGARGCEGAEGGAGEAQGGGEAERHVRWSCEVGDLERVCRRFVWVVWKEDRWLERPDSEFCGCVFERIFPRFMIACDVIARAFHEAAMLPGGTDTMLKRNFGVHSN